MQSNSLGPPNQRHNDINAALLLTYITIAWMNIEGGASLILGWFSKSLSGEAAVERIERCATRLVGYSLNALAVWVVAMSACGLFVAPRRPDTHESAWGVGLIAKIDIPILAGYKLWVAARLNSRALRVDAMEAITCGYFSVVLVVGLAATRLFG